MIWTLAQGGTIKVISLVGQLVITWLLGVGDFGNVGTATILAAFVGLISAGGMKDVLIRRWREFPKYATSAFWLSVVLGTGGTILMLACAPVAAGFTHKPEVANLIRVLAIQNLLAGLCIVPEARLNIDLRFKLLAGLAFANALTLTLLTVLFAALGFGAYSLVLPWPILAGIRAAVLWAISGQRVSLNWHVRLWSHLFTDNALLLGAAFFFTVTLQCDFLILSRLYNEKILGEYVWGFYLSTQALQLLAMNVANVLLPSLARLQDEPQRLLAAFLRAAGVLTLVAVPACVLQITLADPLIRIAFKPEYYPAILIVQILSAGWAMYAVHHSACMLLKAQGRFRLYLGFTGLMAAVFLVTVFVGAKMGAGPGAAVGVGIYSLLIGPLSVYVGIKPLGGTWAQTLRIFAVPAVVGAISTAAGLWAGQLMPHGAGRDVAGNSARAAVIMAVVFVTYVPLIRWLAPQPWEEALAMASAMANRGRSHGGVKTAPL